MMALEQLLASHCREITGTAMSEAEIVAQLSVLDQWSHDGGALVKIYRFENYYQTMAFVNALAFMVHREDHHPDLLVGYNRCEIRYNTHSVSGVSANDFISAAKADAIHSGLYGTA